MYDLNDRFLQLQFRGGHCISRGVFSESLLSCSLYDRGNRFFPLPFNGGQSVAGGCPCFCSMLVNV